MNTNAVYTHPQTFLDEVGAAIEIAKDNIDKQAEYGAARAFLLMWQAERGFVVLPRKPRDWKQAWKIDYTNRVELFVLTPEDVRDGPKECLWEHIKAKVAYFLEVQHLFQGKYKRLQTGTE